MKKHEQEAINIIVNEAITDINNRIDLVGNKYVNRLRTCNARVYETDRYFVLESYRTFVAAVDKETHEAFDFLRWAYGYTSTSAQHINKFFHDYGAEMIYTYRDI